MGRIMGLTSFKASTRTLQVRDVIGGTETLREISVPDAGEPTPLPNPAVVQLKAVEAPTKSIAVQLQPYQETEIKAVMDVAQVILYSWKADGGDVYTDLHGHDPNAGKSFVRYEEQQSGRGGRGSLVAPFSGEQGWYWVSLSEQPVTITLKVTGYFREIKDYGILR